MYKERNIDTDRKKERKKERKEKESDKQKETRESKIICFNDSVGCAHGRAVDSSIQIPQFESRHGDF